MANQMDHSSSDTSNSNIEAKIRAILARANHPNTPQAEAETALALAWKLMQKHGLNVDSVSNDPKSSQIISHTMKISGPYRIRRNALYYAIAAAHSCAGFRDRDQHDSCVTTIFGLESDIFATNTIYTAAELLATRVIPRGDRTWRTAWWHGFTRGITEVLGQAKREFVDTNHGSALVLASRYKAAEKEMFTTVPGLHAGRGGTVNNSHAYNSGRTAGNRFSTGNNSFGSGIRRAIGR